MKFKNWNSEKVLSISAMFISMCTLIVFLYQTNLIRKQQYMSVYPYLSIGNFGSNTEDYQYKLTNNGIGPGIIKSVSVRTEDGKKYSDVQPYVADNIEINDTLEYLHSNISIGRLLPSNDYIEIIKTNDNSIETSRKLHDILNANGLIIEIEYESIYGERWTITSGSDFPIKK